MNKPEFRVPVTPVNPAKICGRAAMIEELAAAVRRLEKRIEELERRGPIIINNPYPVYPFNNPLCPIMIAAPITTPNTVPSSPHPFHSCGSIELR